MELYTTQYDEAICKNLRHLQNYPEMKPFIGKNWESTNYKILLLGESHYIVGDELSNAYSDRTHRSDWYNNNSVGLHEYYSGYINTRKVVNKADRRDEYPFTQALSIFYNTKAAIKEHFEELQNEAFIFPFLSFYNYFQRPAFVSGQSIINNATDNEIGYQTLKEVTKIIDPNKTIFCSSKAYNSFRTQLNLNPQDKVDIFQEVVINYTCHPGTIYWNSVCKSYGNRKGHQKFSDILKQTVPLN